MLLTIICWVLLAARGSYAEDATKSCRRKCSADPDVDPCDNPLPVIPRFLLAGQSNALGFSDQALEGLFNKTIEIVNGRYREPLPKNKGESRERRREVEEELQLAFNDARDAKEGSSEFMAKLMYKMAGWKRKSSVLNNDTILAPHPDVVCSLSNPSEDEDIDCERPVSPIEGYTCGGGVNNKYYGPELMFAHHFRKLDTKYQNNTFGITKVAVGGTSISNWTENSRSNPNYWFSLEDNIRADNGTIEAFFWFQGENDHFPTSIPQQEYLESLKNLVENVRMEIFRAHRDRWGEGGSPTAQFESHKDVPVVILELGPWISHGILSRRGESPGSVVLAQRQFVAEDPNSILVNTGTNDDEDKRLSVFYHYDAPSQLIIGHRLAESFKELLEFNSTITNANTEPDDRVPVDTDVITNDIVPDDANQGAPMNAWTGVVRPSPSTSTIFTRSLRGTMEERT